MRSQREPGAVGRGGQQRDPPAQQHRHDVDAHLIDETGGEQAAEQLAAAKERDVLAGLAPEVSDDRLRVIVLTDDPSIQDELTEQGITAFSSLFATHTLLKGLIVFPASVRLLTQKGDSIQEITVNNERYNELLLRHLPFLGDALVLRIYRGEDSVIPHGDTQIKSGDRLLVSGSPEHIQQMRKELE